MVIIKRKIILFHVHLLISSPLALLVAQLMQYLKGRSSKKLQEEFSGLRKQFWGQHMWATGYFSRNVGTITNKLIEDYVESQESDIDDIFKGDIF